MNTSSLNQTISKNITAIRNVMIGQTPLVYLEKYSVYAKLERNNPTGSIKDRPVYFMVLRALQDGLINSDTVIVEPTSGNTGIALAWIGAKLGIKVIITMPETVSIERRQLLTSLGADVVLTEDMTKAIEKAREIASSKSAFMPNQFENPENVKAHFLTTGPELLTQMNYQLDAFVAGIGTGGTITGVGKFLKSFRSDIKIIGVEPKQSPVVSGGTARKHKIQGIGAGFVPKILDIGIIDEIVQVDDQEAIEWTTRLWKEGIFAGISAAANLIASVLVRKKYNLERVATVFPDDGSKYISVLPG
ncbi:PLP-dependent cysteine synthase family protein [Fervidobacterium islandicum]|uniref:PLP-dependent cysteine synthase family protein n=1 Tax=Fervidobacterium islandicum TaxID=2423 RepID=UPI003A768F91